MFQNIKEGSEKEKHVGISLPRLFFVCTTIVSNVYIWVYSCLVYVLCLLLIHFFFIIIDPIIPLKQEVLVFLWLFVKRQTSDRSSNNEWQRVVMNGTSSDNESQRVVQWVTASDNEWQWVTKNDNEWLLRPIFFFLERILPVGTLKGTL